jgi:2,4'-dihydroxyacetophenone dioxygenase
MSSEKDLSEGSKHGSVSSYQPAPNQVSDLVVPTIPTDERLWVPQTKNVWFRPIMFNVTEGAWVNLLRIKRSGILNRHRHPAPVYGYVIKGSWRYLEHDWLATEGTFVFEPPGEVHTLVVDDDVDEMITLFHVRGTLIYMDQKNTPIGYDDVHSKLRLAREHFDRVGLGADYVEQFIR